MVTATRLAVPETPVKIPYLIGLCYIRFCYRTTPDIKTHPSKHADVGMLPAASRVGVDTAALAMPTPV